MGTADIMDNELLDALDDDEFRVSREEDGTWTVCDAEMSVLAGGITSSREAAEWIIGWQCGCN